MKKKKKKNGYLSASFDNTYASFWVFFYFLLKAIVIKGKNFCPNCLCIQTMKTIINRLFVVRCLVIRSLFRIHYIINYHYSIHYTWIRILILV